ncbi:MAG TPA: hypothetical protein VJN43_01515 [Bryobacteraceae bacterium]|nr:hypothetical protein [Bryobacteraceae bacterium]
MQRIHEGARGEIGKVIDGDFIAAAGTRQIQLETDREEVMGMMLARC